MLKNIFPDSPVSRLFLGLCPVVAAAAGGVSGLALGLIMLFVLVLSGLILMPLKKAMSEETYIPAAILICCVFGGIAELLLNMLFPLLAGELGVFTALCAVGAMLTLVFAQGDPLACGVKAGLADLVMLVLVGVIRELIGYGSFFGCPVCSCDGWHVLAARFPAGAFILLGVLLGIIAAICGHKKEGA